MHHYNHLYRHGDLELHGYVSLDNKDDNPKPAVLVLHDWSGHNEFVRHKADFFAALGYVGFAADIYGLGRVGETIEEKQALMQPFLRDRLFLRTRIQAALEALKAIPEVDSQKIAVVGFCFGGLCALDLARGGANLSGVISVHGLLDKDPSLDDQDIRAKILVLHGADDPMVSQASLQGFCEEMNQANVDWQLHVFGHAKHAFTNPKAHNNDLGTVYNAQAARRSTQLMGAFLEEIFG